MREPQMQYATLEQQGETAQLGMWVFIATEILFFGALLFSYFICRISYPDQFALAGRDTKIVLGTINTVILLTSSLTMIAAIDFLKRGRRHAELLLLLTALLGLCFLGVKGYEYLQDFRDQTVPVLNFFLKPGAHPPTEIFWVFYFVATGFHAIHLTIGVAILLIMAAMTRRGVFSSEYYAPVETLGLYWSLVDAIWLLLFAAIYPLGRANL